MPGGIYLIMWRTGTGSEVMRRIAAPMVGGMVSSAVLTLLVIPAIYALLKLHTLVSASRVAAGQATSSATHDSGKEQK